MATSVPYTTFDTAIRTHIDPKVTDNIFRAGVLWDVLYNKNKKTHAGSACEWPIEYAQNPNVGTIKRFGEIPLSDYEYATKGNLPWIHYVVGVPVSEIEERENAGDKEKVFDIVTTRIESGLKTFRSELADDVFSLGTGGIAVVGAGGRTRDQVTGLKAICTADAAYGGITPTLSTGTNLFHQPYQIAVATSGVTTIPSTGEALDLSSKVRADLIDSTDEAYLPTLTNKVIENIANGPDGPDLIVCAPNVYSIWLNIFAGKQQDMTNSQIGKMGYKSLNWGGIEIVQDKHCPAGYQFVLNTDYLEVHVLGGADMKWSGFKDLPKQDGKYGYFPLSCQFVCTKRGAEGMISGIPTF